LDGGFLLCPRHVLHSSPPVEERLGERSSKERAMDDDDGDTNRRERA
jgi:hypothetical protein